MTKYKENKAKARQMAIDWQVEQAKKGFSYGEYVEAAQKFAKLGKRFGLLREYRENAIL